MDLNGEPIDENAEKGGQCKKKRTNVTVNPLNPKIKI